ncbi:MAG: Holliday junction ATP-dependent DNA helicase RuvB [Ignavibacteria bacterium]|nr:Holliday junction ATP-dependent DNA helicase RuvB [Ignavibacteria bacterium]
MSDYKVSARKYRPQKFSDVSSQEFVTQTLKNAILSGKIAHSYLLSGPRGVGKTTIARILAKALNCEKPDKGEPCNKCNSCVEITNGIHPDIFELDAASNRGIDDVRAIQDAAKFFPIKSRYKFFIVDEVHMLTQHAFNALLKILEEPPGYLIFILATTNPEKIPATIVSRCQRFPLQRIKISEITENLKYIAKEEKIKIDKDSLFLIAKLGDGALRDAQGVFDMAVSFCGTDIKYSDLKNFLNIPDKEIYFEISKMIREGNTGELLKYFNELNEKGFDLQTFFHGLTEHIRDLMIVKSTGNSGLIDESDSIKEKYSEESEKFTEEQIDRLLKILIESESRFKYSSNQKILTEALLAELSRVNSEVADLAEILSELEAVKKKSKSGNEFVNKDVLEKKKDNIQIHKKNNSKNKLSETENKGNHTEGKAILKEGDLAQLIKHLFDAEDYNFN